MAEVYRAVDAQTGRAVVLKLPHVSIAGDIALYNRCRPEMDIAARLDNPGLQRLLSAPSEPYVVFEYIEGESLRASLRLAHLDEVVLPDKYAPDVPPPRRSATFHLGEQRFQF